jgi:transcriptional regulator with XRE-family HTH domain
MRRLREILRLRYEAGFTQRAIADVCRIGLGTVSTYLQRAEAAALTWPLADDLDDAALEARLFVRPAWPATGDRALPDWRQLHFELHAPRHSHPAGHAEAEEDPERLRTNGRRASAYCHRRFARNHAEGSRRTLKTSRNVVGVREVRKGLVVGSHGPAARLSVPAPTPKRLRGAIS